MLRAMVTFPSHVRPSQVMDSGLVDPDQPQSDGWRSRAVVERWVRIVASSLGATRAAYAPVPAGGPAGTRAWLPVVAHRCQSLLLAVCNKVAGSSHMEG